MELLPLVVTFVLMWLLLVRPQQRRVRQHQQLVASLRVGDQIITAGGFYGRVTGIDDEAMSLEVAPGVVVRALPSAVSQRVSPADEGTDDTGDSQPDGELGDMGALDPAGEPDRGLDEPPLPPRPPRPTAEENS